MSTDPHLDDWLDRWEELKRLGIDLTPEELIEGFSGDIPSQLVAEFRRRAALLAKIDQRLDEAAAAGTSGSGTRDLTGDRAVGESLHAGAEPVPGYHLVEPLGKGGFGVVWKARGPGGFHVALKFVPLAQRAGGVELRALEVIKEVRHPNLLATFGTWRAGGNLVIAMELADRALLDRLREAVAAGHPGIPDPEIHEYMREVAKGIDFLNEPRHSSGGKENAGIQHRDIKPQNLLLVGGSAKVADFGLARLLEQSLISHTGSMTLAYAAPEFFKGQTSSHSDQYSLAVTYCELRGNRVPFTGNQAQLTAGHLRRAPNLAMLPEPERASVARALAKKPNERWPSCRDFVAALERSRSNATFKEAQIGETVGLDGLIAATIPPANARDAPAPNPAQSSSLKRPILIVSTFFLILVAGFFGLLSWQMVRLTSGLTETSKRETTTRPVDHVDKPSHQSTQGTEVESEEIAATGTDIVSPAGPLVGRVRTYWRRRPSEAIRELTKAIQLDSKCQPAYYLRGCAYFMQGDLDRAIVDFDESIQLDPEKGGYAQNMRGRSYARKGLYHRALRDLDEAIRLNPRHGVFYFHRGEVYSESGDLAKGEADQRKAVELDPELKKNHPGISKKAGRRKKSTRH